MTYELMLNYFWLFGHDVKERISSNLKHCSIEFSYKSKLMMHILTLKFSTWIYLTRKNKIQSEKHLHTLIGTNQFPKNCNKSTNNQTKVCAMSKQLI